ncbi:hypothetical protein [Pedobacter paludis]|nr:hypothetical protein [Pedobacter paludis]
MKEIFKKAKIKSKFLAKSFGYGVINEGKIFSKIMHEHAVVIKKNINQN